MLTLNDLNAWYSKNIESGANVTTNETFQKIYAEQYLAYQNLVDNHAYYWLGVASSAANLRNVTPSNRHADASDHSLAFGARVLVSIPLESLVKTEPIAERTVTEDGMAYNGGTYGPETVQTYNVWELR